MHNTVSSALIRLIPLASTGTLAPARSSAPWFLLFSLGVLFVVLQQVGRHEPHLRPAIISSEIHAHYMRWQGQIHTSAHVCLP